MRISTPYKHPKSGIYYFRRAVPKSLRKQLNKTIIKETLGTRDPGKAQRLFAVKQIECEKLFEAARNGYVLRHKRPLSNKHQIDEDITLQYLFDKFNQERQVSRKTVDESQKVINRFNGVYNNIAAKDINGTVVREFKELLIKTPSILSNKARSLTLLQIATKVGDNYSGQTLSDSSINKHLSVISSVLQWAANNSYFDDNWHNPVRGKTVKRNSLKRDRMPFTGDDLNKIFSSDIYTQKSRPRGGAGEASFWMPIIALHTGMRLEEIGQLQVVDIKQENNIWYFDINDFDNKKLKNKSSVRKVPVHQVVIDLDFIDYVGSLDSIQIFPLLKKDKYGNLTQNWSKWFGRCLPKIGINDSSKVFHSFRHLMKDALRNAGVDEATSDAITGHSSTSIGRSYGVGYSLDMLSEAIQKVKYDICIDHKQRLINKVLGGITEG